MSYMENIKSDPWACSLIPLIYFIRMEACKYIYGAENIRVGWHRPEIFSENGVSNCLAPRFDVFNATDVHNVNRNKEKGKYD